MGLRLLELAGMGMGSRLLHLAGTGSLQRAGTGPRLPEPGTGSPRSTCTGSSGAHGRAGHGGTCEARPALDSWRRRCAGRQPWRYS
ncbi:unnamed protein product [Miscanthus lutarioriparius]|uniref:Uncharacterized protein n=1 Tax=Miscanthus lutarioriparius TaxID=422564 RepID=A0A811NIT5_9POAL|nr:unnamed protein product [Miscanthus lutarioriparius]